MKKLPVKSIIRLTYLAMFLFILVLFILKYFTNDEKRFGISVFNFTFILMIVLASVLYTLSSMIMRTINKKGQLKTISAIKNLSYAREVVAIVVLATPVIAPILFSSIPMMIKLSGNLNMIAIEVISSCLALVAIALITTICFYIYYKKTINEALLIDELTSQIIMEDFDINEIALIQEQIVFSEKLKHDSVAKTIKNTDNTFLFDVFEQKQLIISETLRSANPPMFF
jgi:hypothetical protein